MKIKPFHIVVLNVLIAIPIGYFEIPGLTPPDYLPITFPSVVAAALVGSLLSNYLTNWKHEFILNVLSVVFLVVLLAGYYVEIATIAPTQQALNKEQEFILLPSFFFIMADAFFLTTFGLRFFFFRPSYKLLFFSAYPDDQARLTNEFDEINSAIYGGVVNVKLLTPIFAADYKKLIHGLTLSPEILHYSGHGYTSGLCLVNPVNGNTQLIGNDDLVRVFRNRKALKLIFFNSCFSSSQAKILSEDGRYVIGLKKEVEDFVSVAFAKLFYSGFSVQDKQLRIEQGIRNGCVQFATTYPQYSSLISLWKNGDEVDYKTL